jgi:hypothetical protein
MHLSLLPIGLPCKADGGTTPSQRLGSDRLVYHHHMHANARSRGSRAERLELLYRVPGSKGRAVLVARTLIRLYRAMRSQNLHNLLNIRTNAAPRFPAIAWISSPHQQPLTGLRDHAYA